MSRSDPSKTGAIRRAYETEFVRRVKAVKRAVSVSIGDRDALGLGPRRLRTFDDPKPAGLGQFVGLPIPQKVDSFSAWLRSIIDEAVIRGRDLIGPQVEGAWTRTFVRRAYIHGVLSTMSDLRRAGRTIADQAASQILNSPFHRSRLEALYARNLDELKGMTDAMAATIKREIADALLAGRNPIETARRIRAKMDISIRRARLIARTETIRVNADAALSTFEQFGERGVSLDAEIVTAGDDRVCPECEALSGHVFTIQQARGIIPVHPSCRCDWLPVQIPMSAAA